MFEKFTDKARKVMSLAQDEARSLGKMYVGTEHQLLALIKEGEGIAAQALAKLDVTYTETLATVKEISSEDNEPIPGGHIPFTPLAKRVLEDPALSRVTFVPPVEIISQPSFLSSWANSTMPALSETLIKAFFVILFLFL